MKQSSTICEPANSPRLLPDGTEGWQNSYPCLRMKDLPCHRCHHQLLRSTNSVASGPMCRADLGHGEGKRWIPPWITVTHMREKEGRDPWSSFPSGTNRTRSSWVKLQKAFLLFHQSPSCLVLGLWWSVVTSTWGKSSGSCKLLNRGVDRASFLS